MITSKRKESLYAIIATLYFFSSCTSCQRYSNFKNCTNDTLFIGASHYDNIDSVDRQLDPLYYIAEKSILDTTDISLWERRTKKTDDYYWDFIPCKYWYIYPDSICSIDYYYLNGKDTPDSCYFFLVKWSDAKQYSWDEIRENKLYRKWVITRDKNGEYDTNIRY